MLHVVDNFLGDSSLADDIRADSNFFPTEMEGLNFGEKANLYHSEMTGHLSFMFWEGWWRSPANTLKKKLIQRIWQSVNIMGYSLNEIAGFEYWARTFLPGQYLAPHVDEDTFAYQENRSFRAPAIGCVWYGFTSSPGNGFLELHEGRIEGNPSNALERESIVGLLSPPEKRERLSYRPDRLIVFDSGRRIHETTPSTEGERKVLVVNMWLKNEAPLGLALNKFFIE